MTLSTLPTDTPTTTYDGLLRVAGADTQVPLLDGGLVAYANLDGAASAPPLQAVLDRLGAVTPWYASVHRGAGYLSQVSTTLYESARDRIGAFVDSRPDDVTVMTRNTTDALNLLASVVPGRVLVLDVEHHANLLTWRRADFGSTVVAASPTLRETVALIEAELVAEDYALLAVTGASNVTGELLPLTTLANLAHRHGTRIVVDGAQLLPHRRLSLAESDIDYVALSGHKLYAPYGAGALVGRRDWLDAGTPYLAGGGAVADVELADAPGKTDRVRWNPAPARHEAGSPNVLGAVALAAACDTLAALDPAEIVGHEQELRQRLLDGLSTVPGVRVARIWADSIDATATITFTLGETDPGLLAAYLAAEHGIGVRDGRFCAHPLLARLGLPSGAIRASIGLATTAEHIDRLVRAVRDFDEAAARTRYGIRDGAWAPLVDPRGLPAIVDGASLIPTAGACTPA